MKALALMMCALIVVACKEDGSGSKKSAPDNGEQATGATSEGATTAETAPPIPEDLDMKAEDFNCILDWDQAGAYRITNKLGHLEAALAVAKSADGGNFPVGTVIQLIPLEAMVKRKAGWSPETNDWEFFSLKVTAEGATIDARGTKDVANQFGGNCLECHAKAEAKWDFVCGTDHGCDSLPFGPAVIKAIQDGDPRCGK